VRASRAGRFRATRCTVDVDARSCIVNSAWETREAWTGLDKNNYVRSRAIILDLNETARVSCGFIYPTQFVPPAVTKLGVPKAYALSRATLNYTHTGFGASTGWS
jgi:hypothetical protein